MPKKTKAVTEIEKRRKEFWRKNLKTFRKYWETVPEENVSTGLISWSTNPGVPVSCGTIACAGGWVALMPPFVAMGVYRAADGSPSMKLSALPASLGMDNDTFHISDRVRDPTLRDFQVSKALFGHSILFGMRDYYPGKTDKQVVLLRVEKLLRVLAS